MTKKVCDRCGKEIKDTLIFDPGDIYTHYDIRATIHATAIPHGPRIIDLCHSCEKEFSDWLSNKEAR